MIEIRNAEWAIVSPDHFEEERVNATIDIVCQHYQTDRASVVETRWTKGVDEARAVAMYACREVFDMTFKVIAFWFNRKEDAPRAACKKVRQRLETRQIDDMRIHSIMEQVRALRGTR